MNETVSSVYFPQNGFSPDAFAHHLSRFTNSMQKKNDHRPILFLCIGSDRVFGDCLGPLIGYKLTRLSYTMPELFTVKGSLSHPVHALNLKETLKQLRMMKQDFLIIAIDAAIGSTNNLGTLCLCADSLRPGEGVFKSLPAVGDISITAVTSSDDNPIPFHRQNIPLSFIMKLADNIYDGIFTFLTAYCCQSKPCIAQATPLLTDHCFPDKMNQTCQAACTLYPYQEQIHNHF